MFGWFEKIGEGNMIYARVGWVRRPTKVLVSHDDRPGASAYRIALLALRCPWREHRFQVLYLSL